MSQTYEKKRECLLQNSHLSLSVMNYHAKFNTMTIKSILVIRFRQMGDAVLSTPLLNTLRKNFPEAQIDFVLNSNIAPLFEGHNAISNIITFNEEERYKKWNYIRKIWKIVNETHYDVIIDMRSTINTLPFTLFSPFSKFRIGLKKGYTRPFFNYSFPKQCLIGENMVEHNLKLASPLHISNITHRLSLPITQEEITSFKQKMYRQGIDFTRPIMLAGVTAKLDNKTWPYKYIIETILMILNKWPTLQIVFNYAPGKEEKKAKYIYEQLGKPKNIFINIQALNMRQLAAMAANCSFYFGNEGGTRHIVQAMGLSSFVICSPNESKEIWLPQEKGLLTCGIEARDIQQYDDHLSLEEKYELITPKRVWIDLDKFITTLLSTKK